VLVLCGNNTNVAILGQQICSLLPPYAVGVHVLLWFSLSNSVADNYLYSVWNETLWISLCFKNSHILLLSDVKTPAYYRIATELQISSVAMVRCRCSQHVGGFHGRLPHMCYMYFTSNPPSIRHSSYIWQKKKFWSCTLGTFFQHSAALFLFSPNILLSTLFPDTLSLCSSLNYKNQFPHA
jgi:hypothetical protein